MIIAILMSCIGSSFAYALEHSPHYHHRKTLFEQHGQSGFDIVFLGDSITERSIWTELFPNRMIANRGIGGDRTDGMLERLDSVKSTGAQKVFIMAGINDIAHGVSVDDIFSNYQSIVLSLKSAGMSVIIQSTLYADRDPKWNTEVTQLNEKLRRLSKAEELTYIDLNQHLSSHNTLKKQFSDDGLHLNGEAYGIWAKAIQSHVLK